MCVCGIAVTCLYGLEGACLNKAERNKLDGFHARCVRRILKISPSFISRVSNNYVLREMGTIPLSEILQQRQLNFLSHIYCEADDHPLRSAIFMPGSVQLCRLDERKRGRPRTEWAPSVVSLALQIAGDAHRLNLYLRDPAKWKDKVKKHFHDLHHL